MMIITLLLLTTQKLQLDTRKKFVSMNTSGGVPGCAMPQILCQLHDHAKQYDNDGACHNKRNGGSCMTIYLRMDMEMP